MKNIFMSTATDITLRTNIEVGQIFRLTDRGNALFSAVAASRSIANGYSVLSTGTPGVTVKAVVDKAVDPIMFGFNDNLGATPSEKTVATHNRKVITYMFAACEGKAITVHMPADDFVMDVSEPVVVPPSTTVQWGGGTLKPIHSAMQPDEATVAETQCYGAIFVTGLPSTGVRFSAQYPLDMGVIKWSDVKITNNRSAYGGSNSYLCGIAAYGGINVFERCTITGMPNSAIYCEFFEEAHYVDTVCRDNGYLTGYKNSPMQSGITNISTQSTNIDETLYPGFAGKFATRQLTVRGGTYTNNSKAGIMFANIPFVSIRDTDCSRNGLTGIHGPDDDDYKQASRTRVNDQIFIHGCNLLGRGVSTGTSLLLQDGYNKDVYMGGNIFGNCAGNVVTVECSDEGSIEFTDKNRMELIADFHEKTHGFVLTAGRMNLNGGVDVTGDHDRSDKQSVLFSIRGNGTDLQLANVVSDVRFIYMLVGKVAGRFTVRNVNCPTFLSFISVHNMSDGTDICVEECSGDINSSGYGGDHTFLVLNETASNKVKKLMLANNTANPAGYTQNPVKAAANGIERLVSRGNNWAGYANGLTNPADAAIASVVRDMG
ncbi:MAG: hypothetical protein OIF57_08865 [Marinobacterium sp.]|nr:hypothetical protein [Marinobacterium sp.]